MQIPNVEIINMTFLLQGIDYFIPLIRAFFWVNLLRYHFFNLRDFLAPGGAKD